MTATNFKTENNTLRKLIGNGLTYKIPRFQRDYSWEVEQWEDLWADIMASLQDGPSAHYMGYLVLQSMDDKAFDVIDGQQRLTTATLIILAVLKNIQRLIDAGDEAEANTQRLNQIRQTYIGYLDPVTLVSRPKLSLNRNNNDYFQNYLVPLSHLPQRGLRASEHLLRKAFEWFDKQVANFVKYVDEDKGVALAKLVENISDMLFFTVITVTDELNAYKVFETLNARGVQLSSTDLLKNYLFSVLDSGQDEHVSHEIKSLEGRWENIVNRLQAEKFPDFLRTYWNSRHKLARQSDLFKMIRSKIKNRANVFELIRGMEEDLDNYLALTSPELSHWSSCDKQITMNLKMFRVRSAYSLLLATRRHFDENAFSSLLRAVMVITFRYNTIGGYSPAEQEKIYNQIAVKITQGEIRTLDQVWVHLKEIYIDDERFKRDFAEKSIKTTDSRAKRIVRFILCALEKYLSNNDYDFVSDSFNIEHILPQNAQDGWGGFNYEEINGLVYRLGNMTLLQVNTNRDLGSLDYAQKRPTLLESNFEITRKLAEDYSEWTPEAISKWQKYLANQATAIWRVAQLN
jgi:hypothetical protein